MENFSGFIISIGFNQTLCFFQIVAVAIIFVILASMTTFCLETMPSFKDSEHIFDDIEIFYCIFFTIDFLLRLTCCPQKKLLLTNILTWIDFIATLQFYIGFIAQNNVLNFLFMLRLLRIFRLIRFFKDLTGMLVIGQTLKASAKELLLLGLILFVPMMIFSTMIYHAEQVIIPCINTFQISLHSTRTKSKPCTKNEIFD